MPDEVLLLIEQFKSKKKDIPVIVSKNRLAAAKTCLNNDEIYYNLAENNWGADDRNINTETETIDITYKCAYKDVHVEFDGNKRIAILDDGFTALNIKKNVNIILIDANIDIFIQNVIPAGILREPLSALKYADIIVINKCRPDLLKNQPSLNQLSSNNQSSSFKTDIENKLKKYNKNCSIFYSYYKPDKFVSQKNILPVEDLKAIKAEGAKILAVCAIGNSDYFYENLNGCGAPADYKMEFADHYEYAETDFKEITNILNSDDKYIAVTTLKDYVKLKRFKKFNEASQTDLPVPYTSDAYIYELYNKAFDKIYYLDFDIIIDGNFYEHIYDIYKSI